MKDPTHDDKEVSEGTAALQHIADEVERERESRGRSDLDQIVLPDGEALADTLGSSADSSEVDSKPVDDNPSGTDGVIPIQNGMKFPH